MNDLEEFIAKTEAIISQTDALIERTGHALSEDAQYLNSLSFQLADRLGSTERLQFENLVRQQDPMASGSAFSLMSVQRKMLRRLV